jgi:hypothetical protein
MVDSRRDMINGSEHLAERREEEHYQQTSITLAQERSYTDALFAEMTSGFERMDSRFERVETSLDRLERKLDGFIDTQSRANEIAERRLRRLEERG